MDIKDFLIDMKADLESAKVDLETAKELLALGEEMGIEVTKRRQAVREAEAKIKRYEASISKRMNAMKTK